MRSTYAIWFIHTCFVLFVVFLCEIWVLRLSFLQELLWHVQKYELMQQIHDALVVEGLVVVVKAEVMAVVIAL